MKMCLLYQLILVCALMVYKNYCTKASKPSTSKETAEVISKESDDRSSVHFSTYTRRTKARPRDYPYHVAIACKADNSVLCQGALVAPNWMLTSASCFKQYADFVSYLHVLAGTVSSRDHEAFIGEIDYEVYHPESDPITTINDLALIKLTNNIYDNGGLVKPIEMSETEYQSGTYCNYSSFDIQVTDSYGLPLEFILFGLDSKLLDLSACDGVPDEQGQVLRYFCVGTGDLKFVTKFKLNSNITDLGSPLVCNNQLYGIKTTDGFFSAALDFKPWVDSVIGVYEY